MERLWVRRSLAEIAVGIVWIAISWILLALGAPVIVALGVLLIGVT